MSRILGIGIDLVECSRFERLLQRPWARRFLGRVFTDQEQAYCLAGRSPALHFAARFAAKEAAYKALGSGVWTQSLGWRKVEVLRAANGAPRLEFHGHAHELALSLGVSSALLSLSHSSQWAVAQVLLQGEAVS